MSDNKASVSERIKILFQSFGNGNLSAFARELNVSAQAIRDLMKGEKGGPSWPVLQNILRAFPQISTDWLVLGKGTMLRNEVMSVDIPDMNHSDLESVKAYIAEYYDKEIGAKMTSEIAELSKRLAEVDTQALQMRIDEDARYTIYSVIGVPSSGQPYDGLLTVRLNISDEEAIQLVNEGAIQAWYVGRSQHHTANWRTSELYVRNYLKSVSKSLVKS